ncbi:hypothetical protein Esti_005656 [Eimeria stiedai]
MCLSRLLLENATQCSSSSTSESDDDSSSISSRSSSRSETSAESQVERSTGSSLSSSNKGKSINEGAADDDLHGCCLESSILSLAARETSAAAATAELARVAAATRAQLSPAAADPPAAGTFVVSTGECECGNAEWGEAFLFEYRHIRYFLQSPEGEAFHPVCFDVSLPPPVLLHAVQQHASCPWLLQRRQELYGPSNLHVDCRSLGSLFAAEVLQPFYLCQVLAILLWLADDYYCYAIVIAIITAAATVTDVLSTRRAAFAAALKKATETVSLVTVLRRESCSRSSSCDISCSSNSCTRKTGLGRKTISSNELTNGDLLLLQPGMRVPCDLLLLHGTVVLDERSLTGECFPVLKSSLPIDYKSNKHISLEQESRHMVFAGTVVLSSTGSGEAEGIGDGCASLAFGVVCRVGYATAQGGTLRSLIFPSPLRMDFDSESLSFLLCLAGLTVVAASYTAFSLYSRGVPLGRTLIRIADLFTDALPPALRATLSVSLTAAAARIFSLYGISSLSPSRLNICGFVRCVCLDKTGTLTEDGVSLLGCMPICHCGDGRNGSSSLESGTSERSGVAANGSSSAAANAAVSCFANVLVSPAMLRSRGCGYHSYCSCRVHLLQCMSCCSSLASVEGRVAGDPLEACLLAASGWRLLDAASAAEAAANPAESDRPSAADEYEMLRQRVGGAAASDGPTFFIPQQRTGDDRMLTHNTEGCICVARRYPFCSVAMRMSVVAISVHSKQTQIYSKGSPESLLPLCDKDTVPPGTERRVTEFAAAGYRVLVAAWRPLEQGEDWQTLRRCCAERGLRYLGLFVFENKLKEDAKETISALQEAHIDMRILTGDSPHTAIGVAAECGVLDSKEESSSGSFCGCCCCTCAVGGRGGNALVVVEGQESSATPLQQRIQHLHMEQQQGEQQQHLLGQALHQWKGRETLRVPPTKRALILGEVCSRHEESVGRREFLVWSLLLLPRGSDEQQQQEDDAGRMQPLLSLDIRVLLALLPDARQAILPIVAAPFCRCVLTGRAFRHLSRLHVLLGLPFTERCEEIVQQVLAKHQHTLHAAHQRQLQEQQQQHNQHSEELHGASFMPEASAGSSMPLVHPNAESSASVPSQLQHADDQCLQHSEDEQRRPSTHIDKLRDVVEDLLFQTPLLQPQHSGRKSLDAGTEDGGQFAHVQELPQQQVGIVPYSPFDGFLLESDAVQQQQQQQQEDEELLQQEAAEAVQQHLGELQQHHPGELLLPDAAARASLSRVDRIQELLHQSSACRRAEVAQAAAEEASSAAGASEYPRIPRDISSPHGGGALRNSTSLQGLFDRRTLTWLSPSCIRSPCMEAAFAEAAVSPPQHISNGSSRWSLKRLSAAARRLGFSRKSALPPPQALREPLLHADLHQPLSSPQQPQQEQREHKHKHHYLQQELQQKRACLERPSGPPLAAASVDALMHHENCVGALGGMVLTFALRRCCCRCCCCRGTTASEAETQSTSPSQHHSLNQPFQKHMQESHGVCVGGFSQHFKMSLYEFVLRRTALLCRANPQDKGDFISALQQLPSCPFVAMAGDGTNDLLAIKRADMGVSLADHLNSPPTTSLQTSLKKTPPRSDGGQGLQGASLASSFTIGNLSSCVALLREGRCVLQNSISTVVFITLYSIIELSSVVCLYRLAGNLTDSQQYMWVDLLTIMPLSLFLSQAEAPKRLSIPVPPSSLFARPVLLLLSVGAQALIQVIFQIIAYVFCTAQPPVHPAEGLSGKENTSIFFISAMQYLYVCAAVGSSGLQWRQKAASTVLALKRLPITATVLLVLSSFSSAAARDFCFPSPSR